MANVPTIYSIKELSNKDRTALFNAAGKGREDAEQEIKSIQIRSNLIFSPELRESVLTSATTPAFQTNPAEELSGTGSMLSSLGAAAGAALTMDTSGSSAILGDINDEQLDTLMPELENLAANGQISDEQLQELSSDALLGKQYEALEARIRQANAAGKISSEEMSKQLAALQSKHNTLLQTREKERANPNRKQKRRADEEKKRKARLRKDLEAVEKETKRDGRRRRPLTPEEIRARRAQLLRQYAQEQQANNREHLDSLLSKRGGFLGLGRTSTLSSPIKKVLVRNAREKIKKKGQKQDKKPELTQESEQTPEEISRFSPAQPQPSNGSSQIVTATVQTQTEITSTQNTPQATRAIPINPASLAENPAIHNGLKLFITQPEFLAIIGCILLAIILLAVILLLLLPRGNNGYVPNIPTQLSCGNIDAINGLDDPHLIDQQIEKFFHIKIIEQATDLSSAGIVHQAVPTEQQLFSSICLLFGHAVTSPYETEATLNTFGKLVVGTDSQRNDGNLLHLALVVYYDSSLPSCTIRKHSPFTEGLTEKWDFLNPNQCGFNGYQLQFLIAQTLGYSLVDQQNYLQTHNKQNNLSLFSKDFESGPFSTGRLPTYRCANPTWSSNAEPDRDCFADMVGEYLTYPFYLDQGFSSVSTTLSPTFPAPSPTSSHLVFEEYTSNPNYAPYYQFAYTNLFDQFDFFTSPGILQCPTSPKDTVAAIQQDLKTIYGVTLMGDLSDKLALTKAINTWNIVCMMALAPPLKDTLFNPLTATPVAIYWNNATICADDSATHKDDEGNICKQHGVNEDCVNMGSYCSGADALSSMNTAHELGHILNWRKPNLFQDFCTQVFGGRLGTGKDSWECVFKSGYQQFASPKTIPTYSCLYDYGTKYCDAQGVPCGDSPSSSCSQHCAGPYGSECFADMVGEYPTFWQIRSLPWAPQQGTIFNGHTLGEDFIEFPTVYSNYFAFATKEIFGGITYGPSSSPNSIGDFATKLTDTYKSIPSCFHDAKGRGWAYLVSADQSCISSGVASLGTFAQNVVSALKKSIQEHQILECVGFVNAVVAGVGHPFANGYNNASDYIHGEPGYTFIKRTDAHASIQPGDIVVYANNGSNRIAVVTKIVTVSTGGGHSTPFTTFEVAEGNGGYCKDSNDLAVSGCMDRVNEETSNSDISGWLRKQ